MNRKPLSPNLRTCLTAGAGAVAGCVLTLAVQNLLLTPPSPISGTAVSVPELKQSPARESALNRRAGDHSVKLEQIIAADDREHKAEDLRRLGREAAVDDSGAALRLASQISGADDRSQFQRGIMEAMAEQNAAGAAEFALTNFTAGATQNEALRIALGKWGAKDPHSAYAWAEDHLSGPSKEQALTSLVQSWAARSPQEAADWFVATGSTSQPMLAAVLGPWAAKAPEEAAGWVEKLPDAGNRNTGRAAVAAEWAKNDPPAAAEYFAPAISAPPPAGSTNPPGLDLATTLADIWGTTDPAAASTWITRLPEGPGRTEAAATLATVWAASDIQSAAAWSSRLTDPSLRGTVVEHLGTTWGAIEPDKALTWLKTQPADLQPPAIRGAYNSWAGTDPDGLADWITRQQPGAEMDIARRSLADVQAAENPAAALELTRGMTNPQDQADAAARYLQHWNRTDAAGAQEWIDAEWQSLAPAVQARLSR